MARGAYNPIPGHGITVGVVKIMRPLVNLLGPWLGCLGPLPALLHVGDAQWREHGHMERAVDLIAGWCARQELEGLEA